MGDFDHEDAGPVGPPGKALLEPLVQVVPVKEQLVFVGALVAPLVNAPHDHRPLPGVDGALKGHGVAHFPAETLGQPAADDTAPAVLEKGRSLVLGQDKLRVQVQEALGIHGKVREKILAVDVDAAEPGHVGDGLDAVDRPDLFHVGDRQGEGQGYRMADHEAVGGGRGNTRVPGIHECTQHAEGQHRHGDADNGQHGAQRVSKRIPEQQLPEHWPGHPCRGV